MTIQAITYLAMAVGTLVFLLALMLFSEYLDSGFGKFLRIGRAELRRVYRELTERDERPVYSRKKTAWR